MLSLNQSPYQIGSSKRHLVLYWAQMESKDDTNIGSCLQHTYSLLMVLECQQRKWLMTARHCAGYFATYAKIIFLMKTWLRHCRFKIKSTRI